jgi:hypothetical protein
MNLKLPYIAWRDGRPRFEPGPGMRRRGLKGRDLRHDNGDWYSIGEAEQFAVERRNEFLAMGGGRRIRSMAPIVRVRCPAPEAVGFVYFLRSGDHIKIGFSKDPRRRASDLSSGLASGINILAYVPGSRDDERRLHHALRRHRQSGEWFAATPAVVGALTRSVAAGAPMLATD